MGRCYGWVLWVGVMGGCYGSVFCKELHVGRICYDLLAKLKAQLFNAIKWTQIYLCHIRQVNQVCCLMKLIIVTVSGCHNFESHYVHVAI